jgi:serine/threonine protein phosphatase PrpC
MSANVAASAGLSYFAITDQGKVRERNEDCVLLEPWPNGSALMVVVADGIGGQAGGEVASQLVVESFRALLSTPLPDPRFDRYETLLGGFYRAHEAIRKKAGTDFALLNMGSTAIAAVVTSLECLFLYAGDCRMYHFSAGSDPFITADHTVVRILLENGQLSPAEVLNHPMRSVVTSSLGALRNNQLMVDPKWNEGSSTQPAFRALSRGDLLLFCSDGMSEVTAADLVALVARYRSTPEALARACVAAAVEAGGKDNITVAAIAVGQQSPSSVVREDHPASHESREREQRHVEADSTGPAPDGTGKEDREI